VKTELEGLFVAVWDGDGAEFLVDPINNPKGLGIAALVRRAGGEATPEWAYEAFTKGWSEEITDYRQGFKRQHLPLMRLRLTLEAEPLTDEEAERVWTARQGTGEDRG
jgi:hypothetical protein